MFEDADDIAGFFDTEDGFALPATYRVGGVGGGMVVHVLSFRPDRGVALFGQKTVSETGEFLIRVCDVALPTAGDTIEAIGTIYTVQGEPLCNETRTLWTIEAREG